MPRIQELGLEIISYADPSSAKRLFASSGGKESSSFPYLNLKALVLNNAKTFAKHQEVLILLARNQSANQVKKNINYKTHTMETNENLREHIFEIINNQLKTNNPPETKLTFDRLINQGFDDFQVKQMIGQCLSVELFEILKFGKTYNNERYIKNLKKLPKEPFD